MLFCHFPVALACSGGGRRRGGGQIALLAPWASVTAPALWPVIPRHPAPATAPLAGFGRCRLFRVSDTRSKPFKHEDSINGYQQQTRRRTQGVITVNLVFEGLNKSGVSG